MRGADNWVSQSSAIGRDSFCTCCCRDGCVIFLVVLEEESYVFIIKRKKYLKMLEKM